MGPVFLCVFPSVIAACCVCVVLVWMSRDYWITRYNSNWTNALMRPKRGENQVQFDLTSYCGKIGRLQLHVILHTRYLPSFIDYFFFIQTLPICGVPTQRLDYDMLNQQLPPSTEERGGEMSPKRHKNWPHLPQMSCHLWQTSHIYVHVVVFRLNLYK